MRVEIAPFPRHLGNMRHMLANRASFALHFAQVMGADPRVKGVVLDVGSGRHGPGLVDNDQRNIFNPILSQAAELDGVDPDPGIKTNPRVAKKFHATLEEAPLPESHYDAIVSFYVLEHVATPREFMRAAFRTLKPGGAMYAITPHSHHPFMVGTWVFEKLGARDRVAKLVDSTGINSAPTYNRMNSRSTIVDACEGVGFESLVFHFAPAAQWDTYFPGWMRALPHLYDRFLGGRFAAFAQQMMVVATKPR